MFSVSLRARNDRDNFLEQKRAENDKTAKDTWRVSPSRVGATPAGETTERENVNSSTTVTLSTPSRKYLVRGRPKGGNVDKREKRKEKDTYQQIYRKGLVEMEIRGKQKFFQEKQEKKFGNTKGKQKILEGGGFQLTSPKTKVPTTHP